jgi:hypothetical protein
MTMTRNSCKYLSAALLGTTLLAADSYVALPFGSFISDA